MKKLTLHIKLNVDVDFNEQLASMNENEFQELMNNLPEIMEIRKQRAKLDPLKQAIPRRLT